mgnify:CR=1 FL=1
MSKTGSILKFLAKSRAKLNLILTAAKSLTWLFWVAALSGVALLISHWSGWLDNTVHIWVLISLGGGLAGLSIGWWRRLDDPAVARWLDEHLASDEILSAALLCLKRGKPGLFDERIIDAAADIAQRSARIKWPCRFLLKQAYLTLGIIILLAIGLIHFTPTTTTKPEFKSVKSAGAKKTTEGAGHNERLAVESPKTLAKMFFPEDVRMAMLAERALREGDLFLLQQLLSDAELSLERQQSEVDNLEAESRLKTEVKRRRQLMESLIAASEEANEGAAPIEQETGSSQPDPANQGRGEQRSGQELARNGDSHLKQVFNETETGTENENPFDYFPGGGSNAGTGHNPDKGNWRTITARTGREERIISQNKDSRILEYILPGKNSRLPLTEVIPDSRRSAEAAIYREGIPWEYEESIRNYFLLLSEETKAAAIKEAQK